MIRIGLVIFVFVSVISCQSTPTEKVVEKQKTTKKEGVMEEYYKMKAELEPQGYIITTDSIAKIFIDHAVTINYNEKNTKKSK
jgi:uncharacterized protein YqkB